MIYKIKKCLTERREHEMSVTDRRLNVSHAGSWLDQSRNKTKFRLSASQFVPLLHQLVGVGLGHDIEGVHVPAHKVCDGIAVGAGTED